MEMFQETVGIDSSRSAEDRRSGIRAVDREQSILNSAIRLLLVAYVALGVVSMIGFGAFVLRPQNLALLSNYEWIQSFYSISFAILAQFHIGLGFVLLSLVLVRDRSLSWLPMLVGVALVTFLAEFLGTSTGLPFGAYSYSGLLGPKILQHVPVLIPISWFVMAVPAYLIARHRFDGSGRASRLILGAALLTSWDLSLDPAMSFLTSYWIWEQPGVFYGMPLINLGGWFVTSLVAMMAIEWLGPFRSSPDTGVVRWMVVFYCATLLLPVGLVGVAGLWPALLLGTVVPLLLLWYSGSLSFAPQTNSAPATTS